MLEGLFTDNQGVGQSRSPWARLTTMSTKDLIIQELDHLPEPLLSKVLESIRQLKNAELGQADDRVWQAYLASEQENEEVYRRLANFRRLASSQSPIWW